MRRNLVVALAVLVMAATSAQADFGTWNSATVTGPSNTPGTLDVDITLGAGTAGDALAPTVDDAFYFLAQLYYPYPYPATTTSALDAAIVSRGSVSNTSWSASFTLTAPLETPTGVWGWWVFIAPLTPDQNYIYGRATTYGTIPVTYDPNQPTATPDPNAGGNPIPTLSFPGILLLGALLAGVGVMLLRRS